MVPLGSGAEGTKKEGTGRGLTTASWTLARMLGAAWESHYCHIGSGSGSGFDDIRDDYRRQAQPLYPRRLSLFITLYQDVEV